MVPEPDLKRRQEETMARAPREFFWGRCYLAGPMSGYPDFNFPAFHAAAALLSEEGWDIVNPAENFGGAQDLHKTTYLRRAIQQVCEVDAIILLDGWQASEGARLERAVAEALELEILEYHDIINIGFPDEC